MRIENELLDMAMSIAFFTPAASIPAWAGVARPQFTPGSSHCFMAAWAGAA